MNLFQKKSSSLPDKRREAPYSRLKLGQSIELRRTHIQMDARGIWREDGASRLLPAHDGACAS
jgi:hypothetical protein